MCAIPGTGGVVRIAQSGEISTYTTGKRLVFPNSAAFDSEGNRYLTDSGDCYKANGRLLLVRPTGEVEVLIGSYLHYLNGMAIDPSGSWLYLAQTSASNILRFPIEGIRLGDPEIYATIPGTAPDGLALAESGNFYVGCYTPDAIYVVEPDGRVEPLVIDPWADLLNRRTNLPSATECCIAPTSVVITSGCFRPAMWERLCTGRRFLAERGFRPEHPSP